MDKKQKIFFLNVDYDEKNKATFDVYKILNGNMEVYEFSTKASKLARIIKMISAFFQYKSLFKYKKMLVLQDEIFENNLLLNFLNSKRHKKILIIHDVHALRFTLNKKEVAKEINVFNKFDYIISHNCKMTKWLRENGVKSQIVELEMFDYLADISHLTMRRNNNFQIAFPGNLDVIKSEFVYKLSKMNLSKVHFNLYGPNFSGESSENVQYQGIVHPDELVHTFTESFGLVWDGPEVHDCTGDFGEYQRYNNPHKASLYIAAGLPIIISNKAALASFVRDHNIGITIDSLEELETIIPNISDETYRTYTENLKDLQQKVTTGYFITTAINKIEEMIENESH